MRIKLPPCVLARNGNDSLLPTSFAASPPLSPFCPGTNSPQRDGTFAETKNYQRDTSTNVLVSKAYLGLASIFLLFFPSIQFVQVEAGNSAEAGNLCCTCTNILVFFPNKEGNIYYKLIYFCPSHCPPKAISLASFQLCFSNFLTLFPYFLKLHPKTRIANISPPRYRQKSTKARITLVLIYLFWRGKKSPSPKDVSDHPSNQPATACSNYFILLSLVYYLQEIASITA